MDIEARLKELGVEPVVGNQYLVMKEDELQEIEQRLSVQLPEAYRKVLLTFGAVGFRNIISFRSEYSLPESLSTTREVPFSFFYGAADNPHDTYSLARAISIYSGRMPMNLIPIGADISDNQICLGTRNAEKGRIYYWDHDNEWNEGLYRALGWPTPPNPIFQNVHLISESFEDFLGGLFVSEYGE